MNFKFFGPDHLAALGAILILCAGLAWWGRRMNVAQRTWTGKILGIFLSGYVMAAYVRGWLLGTLSRHAFLPLNLCDWVMGVSIIAMFRPSPLAFEVAYFWGFTGALQALITPDLGVGFPHWPYFQFFWGHGGIFLAIIFLISARGFRPRPGSVKRMFLAVNFYAATVGLFDLLFHENYGYLCHGPSQPSLIDHLGPWPWYILSMEVISLVSFWILDLPWKLGGGRPWGKS